jgi:hypothetical protein
VTFLTGIYSIGEKGRLNSHPQNRQNDNYPNPQGPAGSIKAQATA